MFSVSEKSMTRTPNQFMYSKKSDLDHFLWLLSYCNQKRFLHIRYVEIFKWQSVTTSLTIRESLFFGKSTFLCHVWPHLLQIR